MAIHSLNQNDVGRYIKSKCVYGIIFKITKVEPREKFTDFQEIEVRNWEKAIYGLQIPSDKFDLITDPEEEALIALSELGET